MMPINHVVNVLAAELAPFSPRDLPVVLEVQLVHDDQREDHVSV